MDWDRYVTKRLDEHNQELYRIEKRVEELIGLRSEREIRIEEGYLKVMKGMRLVALETMSSVPGARKPVLRDVVSDWDFENTSWSLSTTYYVSPPSSLYLGVNAALCKHSEAMRVTNGMIVSYVFIPSGTHTPALAFRREMPAGSAHRFYYGYTLYLPYGTASYAYMYYYESTSITRSLQSPTRNLPQQAVWNLLRATWWSDPGGAGLMVRLEWFRNNEWVKVCDDLNDPYDGKKTANIARTGLAVMYGYSYFDDTEIWKSTA